MPFVWWVTRHYDLIHLSWKSAYPFLCSFESWSGQRNKNHALDLIWLLLSELHYPDRHQVWCCGCPPEFCQLYGKFGCCRFKGVLDLRGMIFAFSIRQSQSSLQLYVPQTLPCSTWCCNVNSTDILTRVICLMPHYFVLIFLLTVCSASHFKYKGFIVISGVAELCLQHEMVPVNT